jgi:glutathione S-transferase
MRRNLMPSSEPPLLQFHRSHYNEKARWALDYKKVRHTRKTFLPGPHAGPVKKLTGKTEVPVVLFGDEIVAGSARIIDELERRYPDPALYPSDAADRARALEIQSYFDDEVGPAIRTALFSVMIHDPGYLCRVFSSHRSRAVQLGYRAMFPIASRMIAKSMGINDPEIVKRAYAATEKALEFVAAEVAPSGYLVGDRFTVADLTCAALLAPGADPDHPQMRRPRPQPARIKEWHARWQDHAAMAWVRARYATDRPHLAGLNAV